MKWDKTTDRDGFVLITGEDDRAEGFYDTAVSEMVREFCTHILPLDHPPWNYIRVELWPDSGRVIAFPASSRLDARIEDGVCQIVIHDYLARYELIADSEMDDGAFDRSVAGLNQEIIESIVRCFTAVRHDRRFIGRGIRVKVFDYGENPPIIDFCIDGVFT